MAYDQLKVDRSLKYFVQTASINTVFLGHHSGTGHVELPERLSSPIKVWLVDDNQPLRQALKNLLNTFEDVQCTADFHSPNALLSVLASKPGPDVLLLDIQMGEACGVDAITLIKALSNATQILMFTSSSADAFKKRALVVGAAGFLLKQYPIEKIVNSIRDVYRNPAPHLKLAPRREWVAPKSVPPDSIGRQPKPLLWLKLCLAKVKLRPN